MSPGSILIILIIIGAIAALFVVLGRDKKTAPPSSPPRGSASTSTRSVGAGSGAASAGRIKGPLFDPNYPDPNRQTVTSNPGELSIFTYRTTTPFWVCPNCECENPLNLTHCRVCFWDRSVEVR